MKLKNITFKKNVIWGDASASFGQGAIINTVSGKNGSGKTSLFSQVVLVQKAFFCNLLEEAGLKEYDGKNVRDMLGREIYKTMNESRSSVVVNIAFEKKDFLLISDKKAYESLSKSSNEDGEVEIEIGLYIDGTKEDLSLWDIKIADEQKELLKLFWNLDFPVCFFTYIQADRVVFESDIKYEDVRLKQEAKYSSVLSC